MEIAEVTDEAMFARFPGIYIDHDTKAFYKGLMQQKLLINRCQDCGTWRYPISACCPSCWSDNVEPAEVSGRGTIYLLNFIQQARTGEGSSAEPYPVAAIDLPEGVRFTSTIVNCAKQDMSIGMPVVLTWIEQDGMPFPAFQPKK